MPYPLASGPTAQGGRPRSEESCPPSNRAIRGLLPIGDRAASGGGVASTLAGIVSANGELQALQPNPTAARRIAPCPPAHMPDPGQAKRKLLAESAWSPSTVSEFTK